MASRVIEFFGFSPSDQSVAAVNARRSRHCPFIDNTCQKTLSDGEISGVCTLKPMTSGEVICCPYRLYADHYQIIIDVAHKAFGENCDLFPGHTAATNPIVFNRKRIAVFGKRWGKELRLPNRGNGGGYFVDWVLARLDDEGNLSEFLAIEVQSIDTTGNYRAEREAYLNNQPYELFSTAGFNWENVNKRILPQLIYKGHVLRRERLCTSGLFFICPTPVYNKIRERLGGNLLEYQPQSGALTLMWYDLGQPMPNGQLRGLEFQGSFTTTVDQVALAFTSPSNLPEANVYEHALLAELQKIAKIPLPE